MNKNIIDKILADAVLAPSGDNVQPWRFKLTDGNTILRIYNDVTADNSIYNFNQWASLIAIGALIETIIVSADHHGYDAEVTIVDEAGVTNHYDYIASVRLTCIESSGFKKHHTYPAIFNRYTDRFKFLNYALSAISTDAIKASPGITKDVVCNISIARSTIENFAKALKVNDCLVFRIKEAHSYFFSMVRWTPEEEKSSQDGMPIDMLGLSNLDKMMFPTLKSWILVNILGRLGLFSMIESNCKRNILSSSAVGYIITRELTRQSAIEAGRVLQRVWLESTAQGKGFQPIIGLPLLLHNKSIVETSKIGKILKRAKINIYQTLGILDGYHLIIAFRIGRSSINISRATLRKAAIFID